MKRNIYILNGTTSERRLQQKSTGKRLFLIVNSSNMAQYMYIVSNTETKLQTEVLPEDVRQVIVGEEDEEEEQLQDWSSSLDQEEPEPSQVPDDQEELWNSQVGELSFAYTMSDSDVDTDNSDDWESLTEPQTVSVGKKTYPCTECGKTYSSVSSLNWHKKSHVGDKPHTCSVCSKTFTEYRAMRRHMITHSGTKPYTCSYCDKTFSRREHMKSHMASHTGQKPYGCSICGKGFTQRHTMVEHMRIHTGEKPVGCNHCGQRFTWRSQLQRHKCPGRENL
ncbi:zinc finger protein 271-like [Synchiropus splendidus]|uniref:zinc finger protein 271-like n=1 Tax=Synchiropus splendidus TaxID=270530 RepID=UPI00237D53FE|nr:zinc finger protein 271-like [Synchiropus splendidus]